MAGLPEVTLAGTLVADPELRFTNSGISVASFTVACNDRKLDRETNKWVDGDATFVRCSIWRRPAENLHDSLVKGNRVLVTGALRQRSFEKDDVKRTVLELDVTEVGASLKWDTVKVTKAARTSSGTGSTGDQGDPWGERASAGSGSGFAEEPPF